MLPSSGVSLYSYDLPDSYDLSETEYFPPVGNQGHIGSCAAYASTYYQFTYEVAVKNNLNVKENPQYIKSPLWVYSRINGGVDGGSNYTFAYEYLKNFGSIYVGQNPAESYDPDTEAELEDYTNWNCEDEYVREALKTRVSSWSTVKLELDLTAPTITYASDLVLEKIKRPLAIDGKALTMVVNFNDETYIDAMYENDEGKVVTEQAICATTGNTGNHAVTIVGYNNDVRADLNNNGTYESFEYGAFKAVNSWGTEYGNDGYIWIMYDAFNVVSNAENLNSPNLEDRASFGYLNSVNSTYANYFYLINVDNYSTDLMAKIDVNADNRSSIIVATGVEQESEPIEYLYDYMFNKSGKLPYSGSIYCDFSSVFSVDNMSSKDIWHILSLANTDEYNVTSISLVDNLGNKLVENTEAFVVQNDVIDKVLHLPNLQMGDVNYDSLVDSNDVDLLRAYLVNSCQFSGIQQKIVDMDGNNLVNLTDVMMLRRSIEGVTKLYDWEDETLGAKYPDISGLTNDSTYWWGDFAISDNTQGLAPGSSKCLAIINNNEEAKDLRPALELPNNWMGDAISMRIWVGNFTGRVDVEFNGSDSMSYKKWFEVSEDGWIEIDFSDTLFKNGPDTWEFTTVDRDVLATADKLWIVFWDIEAGSTIYLDNIELLKY